MSVKNKNWIIDIKKIVQGVLQTWWILKNHKTTNIPEWDVQPYTCQSVGFFPAYKNKIVKILIDKWTEESGFMKIELLLCCVLLNSCKVDSNRKDAFVKVGFMSTMDQKDNAVIWRNWYLIILAAADRREVYQ